jgi:hypothetical protein
MSEDKCLLTAEQAIAMLDPTAEEIHTFRSTSMVLIGAHWGRKDLIEEIESACGREIGGEQCQRKNHGLVIWTEPNHPLFVECREGLDYESMEAMIRAQDAHRAEPVAKDQAES